MNHTEIFRNKRLHYYTLTDYTTSDPVFKKWQKKGYVGEQINKNHDIILAREKNYFAIFQILDKSYHFAVAFDLGDTP